MEWSVSLEVKNQKTIKKLKKQWNLPFVSIRLLNNYALPQSASKFLLKLKNQQINAETENEKIFENKKKNFFHSPLSSIFANFSPLHLTAIRKFLSLTESDMVVSGSGRPPRSLALCYYINTRGATAVVLSRIYLLILIHIHTRTGSGDDGGGCSIRETGSTRAPALTAAP